MNAGGHSLRWTDLAAELARSLHCHRHCAVKIRVCHCSAFQITFDILFRLPFSFLNTFLMDKIQGVETAHRRR